MQAEGRTKFIWIQPRRRLSKRGLSPQRGARRRRMCSVCGSKSAERTPLWRASAGGGFGPRGAKAPQTFADCIVLSAGLRPASSLRGCCFTTFWYQKVVPKVSARHLRRDRTAVLAERARKTPLFRTPAPSVRTAVRSVSACGALRKPWCAVRNDDFSCCCLFSAGRRPACSRNVELSDKERAKSLFYEIPASFFALSEKIVTFARG